MDEAIQVTRAVPTTDEYGDPIPGEYENHVLLVGKFAPSALSATSEPVEVGRSVVVSGGAVYVRMPSIPDVAATDRVLIRGVEYDIDGEIGVWRRSSEFGIQFAVKRVEQVTS
ncbi:MAG: hypothetical protein R2732_05395 [Microbacteriaceae bacterium]